MEVNNWPQTNYRLRTIQSVLREHQITYIRLILAIQLVSLFSSS